jgi:hypothetical protein
MNNAIHIGPSGNVFSDLYRPALQFAVNAHTPQQEKKPTIREWLARFIF